MVPERLLILLLFVNISFSVITDTFTLLEDADDDDEPVPDEQRLIDTSFVDYDPAVRPVYNSSENVVVQFGFTLIQIMDLEEKNQVLVTNAWLEHIWRDERISWLPENYSGLKVLRVPANTFWLPDIVLYNNADDFTSGYMLGNVMVTHFGEIAWSPPARLRSSCKIDITYFPFDTQECRLKFGSWTYDKAQVDIVNKTDNIDVTNYVSNGEWQLLRYSVERKETVYAVMDWVVYPDVTVTIVIRRRVLYYVLNILFPCIWLSVLSILTFCLPPDEGEKVTLGITVLLSYSVFMLLIAEKMPPTSEFVPLIGIYLTVVMATTCVSIFLTVLVLKLFNQAPNQRKVPRWVKLVVLKWIAGFVHCRCGHVNSAIRNIRLEKMRQLVRDRLSRHNGSRSKSSTIHTVSNSTIAQQPLRSERISLVDHISEATLISPDAHSTSNTTSSDGRSKDRINEYIEMMMAKSEADFDENITVNEWKQVALVMDRLMFWVFFIATLVTTMTLLIFVPFWGHLEKAR